MQKFNFSIANKINPVTKQPFGDKYAGTFEIQGPLSLSARTAVACRNAATLNVYGTINDQLIGPTLKLLIYAFAFMTVCSTEELPEWFHPDKIFTKSDEAAVLAVWAEVTAFLDTFHEPEQNSGGSSKGGEGHEMVVSGQVPDAAERPAVP